MPLAHPLSPMEKSRMRGYFSDADLDSVRVVVADPLPVADPPFSNVLRRAGFDFPGLSLTAAITFDNLIASREPMAPMLLFHELVHVVQYRFLGIKTFAKLYVHGFLSTRSYHAIPLERCAFELEELFASQGYQFPVEASVAGCIAKDRI